MTRPRYGRQHRRIRAKYAHVVAAGDAVCWRCGKPIVPGTPWDMGHRDDDPTRYAGPEHRRCSRATAGRRQVVVVSALPDDPKRGVFWGPPNERGVQQRWSRAWFEWREVA